LQGEHVVEEEERENEDHRHRDRWSIENDIFFM